MREIRTVFEVRGFGARGDGVAKDTAAVQAAVDAANAACQVRWFTASDLW